jgi:predicted hotdog family 3-hydroxylacyl-ACP dehydratase
MIERAAIARLIPHSGTMCLLDRVVDWNAISLTAQATSHRDRDNPLRTENRLGVLCGLEYAAQAMAVHGGLTAAKDAVPPQGFLASVRDVACHVDRLDTIERELQVYVAQLLSEGNRVIYQFRIEGDHRALLSGRAAVLLQGAA